MKLTGKCKVDFEFWFSNKSKIEYMPITVWYNFENNYPTDVDFYALDDCFQYGVYVDFFDSVGILIELEHDYRDSTWDIFVNTAELCYKFKTRQETRQEAVLKANEIYNKQQNKP